MVKHDGKRADYSDRVRPIRLRASQELLPVSSDSPSKQAFVARQPILDAGKELFAYELLFRDSAEAGVAQFPDASSATACVAMDSLLNMGISAVLGAHRGFLNVDLEMLASEAIEALPPERFILEVLETVPAWALERCLELQERGFEIALDDYVPGDPREGMLPAADYVKVDLTLTDPKDLPGLVAELQRYRARLLAEKVETNEEFELCKSLGFELFQGYFFARPTTLSATSVDLERTNLLSAFRALSEDSSTGELEEVFKRDPRLGVQLLRIANSAALGSVQRITSFEHAVMYVGRQQLRRWVLLMLYSSRSGGQAAHPAIELAAVRGRLLELLAPLIPSESGGGSASTASAFVAGMLSLGDAILGTTLAKVLETLQVEREVEFAVIDRKGLLGHLLRVMEALEGGRFVELTRELEALGLSADQLAQAQQEAYAWYRAMEEV